MYQGDLTEDQTLDFTFTTRRFSTGAPFTLAGTPALSVYKANGTTQSTAGITLTVDFDTVTGLNHVRIDTSADAFYATANDYSVVITTGTVDSVSVVGETIATFSIENRNGKANVTQWAGSAVATPSVAGVPEVDLTHVAGSTTDVSTLASSVATTSAELAKVPKSDSNVTWNATALASINAEADAAIETYHLDHLLAATYDPASKPGQADALFNELIESDAGVSRFTANALEQGPSGGGGVADWTADERTAIRSILGIPASGTTPEDPTAGILDAIRDDTNELQTDWANGGRLDLILDARASQVSVDDLPTNAELATALGTADDATLAAIAALNDLDAAGIRTAVGLAAANLDTQLGDIKGATFNSATDSLEAIRDRGDSAWITATSVTVSDKTGFKLASDGLNLVVPADPAAIPVLGTASIVSWIGYFGAWTVNEVDVTSSAAKLRNSADNADLATHTISDDGTTFISSEPV